MTPLLPDAAARAAITTVLDRNLVVEAAAGTGKTTCLVARICELVKAGALDDGNRFAAVTFTLKAAGELKQRLQAELERQAGDDSLGDHERDRLRQGLSVLSECHIGTIHSFCARLLRERPVEAGVVPDFREIDQDEDEQLRLRAWDEFTRELAAGRHGLLTYSFRMFGLDMDTLGQGFLRFAEYPDVSHWVGTGYRLENITLQPFSSGLQEFANRLDDFGELLAKAIPATDELIPVYQRLARRKKRGQSQEKNSLVRDTEEAYRLSNLFKPKLKVTKCHWKRNFSFQDDQIAEQENAYQRFYKETVKPFRSQCQAAVYAGALAAFHIARDIYDTLRRETGVLNFQDLLLRTAAVLRDYPDVRQELAGRFRRLLVDEVQDTDPIQAEILLLLAAENVTEKNWRAVTPRPGSLFIVGDPKQSIYRFRRADIVVYQELKEMVAAHDGLLLGLTANFRSQPAVLEWVNATFRCPPDEGPDDAVATGRFAAADTPYSPAYVPLLPGRPESDADLTGVYRLELLAEKRSGENPVSGADILADEATRIARCIRHALDTGKTVPARGGVRPAVAGDFMIVTYKKASAPVYAAALGKLGIACETAAGGALAGNRALGMLRTYLRALANPDDPVAAVAVARGPLYGVSDRILYRWKKTGRSFLFPYVPADASPDGDDEMEHLRQAFSRLRRHHRLFRHADAVSCLERIVDDLGLWAYSSLGEDPAAGSGALFTALELLKAERGSIFGPGELSRRLDWLMEHYDGDILPTRPGNGNAVRIMNVHKTKGLEAPVVFLTSTRSMKRRPAGFAVERQGGTIAAAMALTTGEFGNIMLASPLEWEEMATREETFLQAERARLNYVAATRAGSMLVVSTHPSGKILRSAFLPEGNVADLIPDILPEPENVPVGQNQPADCLDRLDGDELDRTAQRREEGKRLITQPTHEVERAKPDYVAAAWAGPSDEDGGGMEPELAADVGEVLHTLLEGECSGERLLAEAGELLRERGRPVVLAEEIAGLVEDVRGSDVWRRATSSERSYREVPFTVADEREGKPVLRRGVIDLVFWDRESDGWVIVDYKSDRLPAGADPEKLAKRHEGQLAAYAEAWRRATGEAVTAALVYYIRSRTVVSIRHDAINN